MKAIQVRMGHANIATTMDVYGHLMPNTDADLARALDTLRSEKLEEGPKLIALDSA
jgi:integrase